MSAEDREKTIAKRIDGAGWALFFIMIGGMGTMAPQRRDEIVSLGFRSIVAGTLSTSMTGAVVGLVGGVG